MVSIEGRCNCWAAVGAMESMLMKGSVYNDYLFVVSVVTINVPGTDRHV